MKDLTFFSVTSFLSSRFSNKNGLRLIANMVVMPDGKLKSLPEANLFMELPGEVAGIYEVENRLFVCYRSGSGIRLRVMEGGRVVSEIDFNSPSGYPVFFDSYGDLVVISNKFSKRFYSLREQRFIELADVSGSFDSSADYVFLGCEEMPSVDFPKFHNGILYGIIDEKLIYSEPYFYNVWKQTNFYDFDEPVTNFGIVADMFIVTTRKDLYIGVSGDNGIDFKRFPDFGGLLNTLCVFGENVFWCNEYGVVKLEGGKPRLLDEIFGARFSGGGLGAGSFVVYGKHFGYIGGLSIKFDDNFVENILKKEVAGYVGFER